MQQSSLEPHIHNAASVAIEVMKTDKSVEAIQDDSTHHCEFREPQIDRDAATAIVTPVEGKSGGSNSLGPLGGLVPMQLANTPALRRIFTQAMFSSMPATSAKYPLLGGTTSRIPTPYRCGFWRYSGAAILLMFRSTDGWR